MFFFYSASAMLNMCSIEHVKRQFNLFLVCMFVFCKHSILINKSSAPDLFFNCAIGDFLRFSVFKDFEITIYHWKHSLLLI